MIIAHQVGLHRKYWRSFVAASVPVVIWTADIGAIATRSGGDRARQIWILTAVGWSCPQVGTWPSRLAQWARAGVSADLCFTSGGLAGLRGIAAENP